jgi:alkanesulfonate monooxygenase SsuD/methylene tetrahydromethanopterin reductase-like flavin-dependent oxidoreductase (luciferase family)
VACTEHHYTPFALTPNPNLILSALAMRTQKVTLATLGNLVPMSNPVRLAEELAMIDVMSGGRLMAGLLRGIPYEYLAYNVAPNESRARMREAVDLIVRAWTEPEPFGWEGEYYQFPNISIWPKPLQKPHPRLFMSASNPESAALAARYRATMGVAFINELSWARELMDGYKEAARSCGWSPTPDNMLTAHMVVIADSDAEAYELMESGHHYLHDVLLASQGGANRMVIQQSAIYAGAKPANDLSRKFTALKNRDVKDSIEAGSLICGSPETVIRQIKRIHGELGSGLMSLNFANGNVPDDAMRRGMALFRDRVLPEVRCL